MLVKNDVDYFQYHVDYFPCAAFPKVYSTLTISGSTLTISNVTLTISHLRLSQMHGGR